jgi:hypothetical protein
MFAWPDIPESIRYLVSRNRINEAESLVRRFGTIAPEIADAKFQARHLSQHAPV